jgi:two-component system OmpR family response regulator
MRLLLVEDEQRLAHALRRGLIGDGFVVEVAGDGVTGLELARHGDFDAVVLDVMLPQLSGYDVIRALRAEENWVPVLMLSARAGEHDQADGLDSGADDYLTKPFSYVVLLARLRALLRRTPQARPPVLAAGDIRLDPSTRVVTVDGAEVALSPRELGLLEYLLRRPDRVVTKIEILDHVWDAAAQVNPNAVEVYVGYLRRKLGRRLVETVRGAGYRLET